MTRAMRIVAIVRRSVALSVSIAICTSGGASSRLPLGVQLVSRERVLVYRGGLSQGSNERLFELFDTAKIKPELLRITSSGGDVNLGMDLGEWVFEHHLDVEIVGYCFSSCANYVFLAGRTKVLNPDSILLWHGGSLQKGNEEELVRLGGERGKKYFDSWRKREDAFFRTIHIDQRILTYGQTASHVKLPRTAAGYDYSVEDMAKFGVINVVEKTGNWRWRELKPEFTSMVVRVEVR
jgi:hypothetical protein